MIKTLFTFLLFCITIVCLQGQNKSDMDILMKYKWSQQFLSEKEYKFYITFTSTIRNNKFTYDGETISGDYSYYLSDKPEFKFDNNKVGKVKNGKYLISKNPKDGEISCYEILELNESKLFIQHIKDISNKGYTSTFKPEKK